MDPKIIVFQGDYVKLMIAVKKNLCAITRKPKSQDRIKLILTEAEQQKK
ncbi:MAG: hypothetical protein KGZ75_00430 [Syntrophomonadaceae bacterium]|jgi:hypothetical protein|nr:hypothetical protein [Syntrophomonadaceae bacterium]